MRIHFVRFVLFSFAMSIWLSPAFAQFDAKLLLQKLSETVQLSNFEIGFKDIEQDDDALTINRVRFVLSEELRSEFSSAESLGMPFDLSQPIELSQPLQLAGIKQNQSSFYIAEMRLPASEFRFGEVLISLGEIVYSDVFLPLQTQVDYLDSNLFASAFSLGLTRIEMPGDLIFEIDNLQSQSDFSPQQDRSVEHIAGSFGADFSFLGIASEVELPDDPNLSLGFLSPWNAQLSAEYDWDLVSGDLSYHDFALELENQGQLSFDLMLSGFTFDIAQRIFEMQQDQAQFEFLESQDYGLLLEMLSYFALVNLDEFTIRYDDFGLVASSLETYLSQSGQEMDAWIASILSNERLQADKGQSDAQKSQIRAALEQFLRDPQSIELSISPDQPLPIPALAGLASASDILLAIAQLEVTADAASE